MGSRRDRRGYRRWASDLRVKEVIVPVKNDQKDAGPSKDVRKNQENYECRHTITQNSMKLREHEMTAFCGLVVLQKPPVEDSVLVSKKKKMHKKRKAKRGQYYPKNDATFCNLFVKTNETLHSRNEIVKELPRIPETLEEKLLKNNIERKIQSYENRMKQQQEKNYRRQRRLEKQSLEKQENLVETWLGCIQRRKELRKKHLEGNISPEICKNRQHSRPVSISLISKKYWNDEIGERTPKKFITPESGKEKEKVHVLDELKDEFFEKLVFVDDSDGNSS